MSWYKTGTVTVTNGQTFVYGVDTKFATNCKVGDGFRGPDGDWYEVTNIASETTIGIYPAYQGVTSTTTNYMIAPLQGYNKETAERLRAITDSFTIVTSVAGRTGAVVLNKSDVGLVNVDNTSDIDKPISTATNTALNALKEDTKTLKVAVIGDSLSQTSVRNNEWSKQMCDIIQKLTGTRTLLRNCAINGASFSSAINTKEHSDGTKSQVEEAIEFAPDIVFIALGLNDAIYSSLITKDEMIANAQAVITALRSGIPGVTIIYSEEQPHDFARGVSPTSLTNQDTLPTSHTTITLNGLTNVRINNSTYLNTSLTPAKLAAHKLWGDATTAIRSMVDGWFSANIWRMARIGSLLDYYHVDQMGHTYWAWQAVSYLSNTTLTIPKINKAKLRIKNIDTNLTTNLDAAYAQILLLSPEGTAGANYYGNDVYQRMSSWMLRSRYCLFSTENHLANASHNLPIDIRNALPGSQVWLSIDNNSFFNTNRVIKPDGVFTTTIYSSQNTLLPQLKVAGSYSFYIAVVNPDGSTDAFVQPLTVGANYIPVGATSLRYLTSEPSLTPNAGSTYVNWNGGDHDDLGVGATGTAFTIPAALNGRKVRLRANIRIAVPLTSADTTNSWVNAAIWKNRTAPPGNSVAAGRGLPSQNMILTSAGVAAPAFDLSLSGAAITVATGDVFELAVALSKTSADPAYVKAHSVTWFEIEVVN